MKIMNGLIATIVGAALLSLSATAQAQYQATGDDGITASPKVRQMLNDQKRATASPVVAENMACPKCKDEYVKRTEWTTKGTTKPTVTLVKHLCASCDTTITVAGVGKAKQSVAAHKCSACGSENLACCATGKGALATKGMKKFEIAPVK